MEYYVLKQGRSDGPFTEADLIHGLANGRYSPEDLVQEEGERYWTPLRRLLANEESESEAAEPAAAPEHEPRRVPSGEEAAGAETSTTFAAEGSRFWRTTRGGASSLISRFPYESGVALCVFGVLVLILSYARILIVGPFLLAALIAGGIAMLRGRVAGGLGVCAAAIFIPAVIWSLVQWSQRVMH